MNLKSIFLLFCIVLLLTMIGCEKDSPVESDNLTLEQEIDNLASQYVKVGAMVGIIDKSQTRHVFSYGAKLTGTDNPPDANTLFGIGSITKTFTTTLLAEMYLENPNSDEIVQHYLPPDRVTLPTRNGTEITFVHLATHTSGIPRTPHEDGSPFPRVAGYDPQNPYAAYTTDEVYDYLTNYAELEFEPGTYWEYSNTGVGLLGHVLGLIDGTSYETILQRDIFNVLGMEHSSLFVTEELSANAATGHDRTYSPVPYYTANDIFQGCGHIKSTLNDMFIYLEAQLGITETSLLDAMDLTHQPVMHQGSMGEQCIGWFMIELDDGQKIIYSGGDTNGFSAYIGFNKELRTGAIILLNASFHDSTNLSMGPEIMKAIYRH